MSEKLFDSYTDPIPPIRYDIQRIPIQDNGKSFIYFYDQLGYATPDFALPTDAEPILSLMDGTRSVNDIIKFSSDEVTKEQILGYARFLDEHALLDSEYFAEQAELIEHEYEQSNIHHSVTAGSSYPSKPEKLTSLLNEAFETNEHSEPLDTAKALYAPHIDLRFGMASYVKSFSAIKNVKPKRIFILATSHYSGLYNNEYSNKPFIISNKDFDLPNGLVKADKKTISIIKQQTSHDEIFGTSFSDRAHRIEHSIELPLLFLNHIWQHDFEIVPILVGNFDELYYAKDGFLAHQIEAFTYLLNQQFNDKDTFFLISGDLAHFGKKFGDQKPASELLDKVKAFDEAFLEVGADNNTKTMLEIMSSDYDPYRICGFPPLYTFMNAFPELKGEILSRELWDETERESAVSFGSIFYKEPNT
ncbi:MAG: AmmeMemoRadiSam system protein B [Balneola sp.]